MLNLAECFCGVLNRHFCQTCVSGSLINNQILKTMINSKELKTVADFESLQKGDFVACEFHRDIHDYPKQYRFKVFPIFKVRTDTKEVILQTKNNIYFNYQMFVDGESNLKSAVLINCH